MILIDLNQVLLAGLMAQIANQKSKDIQEDLIRHMILNIIRTHVKNFRGKYGEIVMCCDNRRYWRKDYYPYYKSNRKKNREKSDLDWHLIFDILAKFKSELRENFPYKVVDVEGAEADDIIGTLTPIHIMNENVLIISSDNDFLQLQRYSGYNLVKQYNPAQKKYLVSENPLEDLKEKIIRGDKGDGIPNILSQDDCFINEFRQKTLTKQTIDTLLREEIEDWKDPIAVRNYERNSVLIDLSNIPDEIKEKIINNYEESKPNPRQKLVEYFIKHKLMNLMDVIEDF